jgi:hypothetical protein
MNAGVSWAITAIVVILLGSFARYLFAIWRLPSARRPRTPSYDRFGQELGLTENPDYHENPGEDAAAGPDHPPAPDRQ